MTSPSSRVTASSSRAGCRKDTVSRARRPSVSRGSSGPATTGTERRKALVLRGLAGAFQRSGERPRKDAREIPLAQDLIQELQQRVPGATVGGFVINESGRGVVG